MVATIPISSRLKVYVSYCGADSEFADKLISGLQTDGRFEISIDPDCSNDEADWKSLIDTLVVDADTVVVILSPDAIQSCAWEVECALLNSKRIIPVLSRPLGSNPVPSQLDGLRLIKFNQPGQFQQPFRLLLNSLAADKDWLREHTRLLAHARMWEKASRPNEMLLAGDDAVAAKMWTLSRPDGAPKPTDLHITYICMSEAVAIARASAAYAMQAEREELETLAHLHSQDDGFGRFAKQAYMVVGCWLALLALFSDWRTADAMKQVAQAQNIHLQTCDRPESQPKMATVVSDNVRKADGCSMLPARHQAGN